MKHIILFIAFSIFAGALFAQKATTNEGTFLRPIPRNYEVKRAFEIESLVPMFFTGGYHVSVGYRYDKFRFRISVINGGTYNAEPAGLTNNSANFKRYYRTSPGFYAGYNIWKNLDLYTFLELHTFGIVQKSTGIQKNTRSNDFGGGMSYQFFIGRYFYIQPGVHLYIRKDKTVNFEEVAYHIPNLDLAPVIRVGVRLWKKY
jgi:hypothetical protein